MHNFKLLIYLSKNILSYQNLKDFQKSYLANGVEPVMIRMIY
jgi:hypothetical protein